MNESALRSLMSGEARGWGPSLARAGLTAASWGYGAGVRLRNTAFDRGWKKVHPSPLPVISVGNMTTGGTGKTPLVGYLEHWLTEHGLRVCLLSRGFRAPEGGVNDEALVLEWHCPGVHHLQHPNRVAGAQMAYTQFGSSVLVLDDGFQHRRLQRDVDLVLVDALNPWGYGRLLPRGLLREPKQGLARASMVILTRTDLAEPAGLASLHAEVQELAPGCPVGEIEFAPRRVLNASRQSGPWPLTAPGRHGAFCGIGNPEGFRAMLARSGCSVEAFRTFPDHHAYTESDISSLQQWAEAERLDLVLTTLKDLVKVHRDELAGRPLWAVQIDPVWKVGEASLHGILNQVVERARAHH